MDKMVEKIVIAVKQLRTWPVKYPPFFYAITTILVILPANICIFLAIKENPILKTAPEIIASLILPSAIAILWIKALWLLQNKQFANEQ
ncbi:MAG TPA: hypothetical protein P5089_02800 [Candidatus Portnoybacteria bacterium]|nr:hypothetical protein [Candidatus Portnoybacteria bacterium]